MFGARTPYRLSSPTVALRQDSVGCCRIGTVPEGSIVVLCGEPDHSGLVPVLCDGDNLRMFLKDIEERGDELDGALNADSR